MIEYKQLWTDEEIETARRMQLDGKTFSEIGRALNRTRSSVSGMLHRHGFALGVERKVPAKFTKPVRLPKLREKRECVRLDEPPPRVRADGEPVTILNVGPGECRWPIGDVGDPGFRLCGHQVARGGYCEYHARLAYLPPKRKDLNASKITAALQADAGFARAFGGMGRS
jgi:GcrA cell cycle regulator